MRSPASLFDKSFKNTYVVYLIVVIYLAVAPKAMIPTCPIRHYLGFYCPGCGGVRALRAVLNGSWDVAFRDNALLFSFPVLVLIATYLGRKNNQRVLYTFYGAIGLIVLAFTIARNRPGSIFAPIGTL